MKSRDVSHALALTIFLTVAAELASPSAHGENACLDLFKPSWRQRLMNQQESDSHQSSSAAEPYFDVMKAESDLRRNLGDLNWGGENPLDLSVQSAYGALQNGKYLVSLTRVTSSGKSAVTNILRKIRRNPRTGDWELSFEMEDPYYLVSNYVNVPLKQIDVSSVRVMRVISEVDHQRTRALIREAFLQNRSVSFVAQFDEGSMRSSGRITSLRQADIRNQLVFKLVDEDGVESQHSTLVIDPASIAIR